MKKSVKKLSQLSAVRSLGVLAAVLACAIPKGWAQTSNAPGSLRWSVPLGSESLDSDVSLSSPAIGADGTIYIGTGNELTGATNNHLYSISPRGTTNWIFTADGAGFRSSPALGPDGTVYIGSCDGIVYAFNSGGDLKWSVPLGGAVFSSAALAADGSIYVTAISNYYNFLFSLSPSGATNWTCDLGPVAFTAPQSVQFSSPSIGSDGSMYVASMDKNLYSIRSSGQTNWTLAIGAPSYASPSIGPDGTIYIGSDDTNLYAVNPDGTERWRYSSLNCIESSVAVSRDGTIYSAGLDGFLRAFDPSGRLKWSTNTGVISASPSITSDGAVIVSTHHLGNTFAYNGLGQRLWTFRHGQFTYASTAVDKDGTIYLAATMRLYALNGTTSPDTGWPMFRKDAQHRSRTVQCSISPPVISTEGATLALNVETDRVYTVQASADMHAWLDITNFMPDNFHPQVFEAGPTAAPTRFYRLRTQ